MRNMLVRAAEVRESEQQQIFDALDDIYARLAPVESLGAVRKRLSELPDRTEVGVLAERLDETMSRLEAQDNAIAAATRAIESVVDRLAKPFAQLDGRLDGVSGRFEGVQGKMEGLEDKLQNIHRRLDELEVHLDKQDSRLESLPSSVHGPVRERIEVAEGALRERIDTLDTDSRARTEALDSEAKEQLAAASDSLRTSITEAATQVDPADKLDAITAKLDALASTVADLGSRIETVEEGVTSRFGDLDGIVKARFSGVEGVLNQRPDTDALDSLVRKRNEESERRIGGQLDEAMATFAELMLGGPPQQPLVQTPPPRQPRRTRNTNSRARNGSKKEEADATSE
ncbi:MAG: PA containing protein [Thermocrispum sp.]